MSGLCLTSRLAQRMQPRDPRGYASGGQIGGIFLGVFLPALVLAFCRSFNASLVTPPPSFYLLLHTTGGPAASAGVPWHGRRHITSFHLKPCVCRAYTCKGKQEMHLTGTCHQRRATVAVSGFQWLVASGTRHLVCTCNLLVQVARPPNLPGGSRARWAVLNADSPSDARQRTGAMPRAAQAPSAGFHCFSPSRAR